MKHNLTILPGPAAAARAAADAVLRHLEAALADRPRATFAVSGGSTPKMMFEELARHPFDWNRVHLFWVDERCVAPDHPDSNYGMTREALLGPLGWPEDRVHRVVGELPHEQAALRYVMEIQTFFGLRDGGLPRFDLVHLGMGSDGHTASLFPHQPLIRNREDIAASVYSASRDSYRVSLLPGPLLDARSTLFLAAGSDKAETLAAVLAPDGDELELPARLVAHKGRNVEWIVDQAAAEKVTNTDARLGS